MGTPIRRQDHHQVNEALPATGLAEKRPTNGHFVGHIPTPSSYESATPVAAPVFTNEPNTNGTGPAGAPRRAHSFSHPVPDIRNGINADWVQSVHHEPPHSIPLDPTADTYLDAVSGASTRDIPGSIEEVFPFEGFNVEDLWNWMLYFDSPRGTEVI
jgi:hypothetical protein